MKTGLQAALGAIGLALGSALVACAQQPNAHSRRAHVLLSSGGMNAALGAAAASEEGQLVREIDDPQTGDRWLLLRNDELPGGPGRWVRFATERKAMRGVALRVARQPEEARALPVIRAGERLTVEEHTAHVDALLEARALGPAAAGSPFEARLVLGGRVVRAVALGPGRAALAPEPEARP